jgi:hypothetical protein
VSESRPRQYQRSGVYRLKNALRAPKLHGWSSIAKTVKRRTRELVDALGGAALLSVQQRMLVDDAVRTKILLDAVDYHLLAQESPLVGRTGRKTLQPVARDRMTLAAHLRDVLRDLGLERRGSQSSALDRYRR